LWGASLFAMTTYVVKIIHLFWKVLPALRAKTSLKVVYFKVV
jgi:hypothetical protein